LVSERDFIDSKTDLKGRITYANRIFMRMAGWAPDASLNWLKGVLKGKGTTYEEFIHTFGD
jgi:hypothetical protein